MLKECAAYRCVRPKQTLAIESKVPVFASEEQAESFLAELIATVAPDLEPAEAAAMIKQWIEVKRGGKELELKVINSNVAPVQKIEIVGGLPPLPGTNIAEMGGDPVIPRSINGVTLTTIPQAPATNAGDQTTAPTSEVPSPLTSEPTSQPTSEGQDLSSPAIESTASPSQSDVPQPQDPEPNA
jgi:hypothetical protein